MASNIPAQSRAVDPYASYNSNVVNQLTGIVTRGSNALDYDNSLQVISDSTAPTDHVEVLTGIVYKDDMLIEITSPFSIDFTDPAHYISAGGDPFNTEAGIYYIVLEYTYRKSRPAPKAYIKILLPSQTSSFRAGNFSSLFFLKAVNVVVTGGSGSIADLYDYDPSHTDTKREYLRKYAGTETILPTFQQARDQSRLVYVPEDNEFYLGYSSSWGSIGGSGASFQANTMGFDLGDLVYVTAGGNLANAIGTLDISTADGVVTLISATGSVRGGGRVTNVKPDAGSSVDVGDLLYLSNTTSGCVTDVKDNLSWQFVGRCLEVVDSTNITVLFVRGEPNGVGGTVAISGSGTLLGTNWIIDSSTLIYQDIDISGFDDENVAVTLWDSISGFKIQPYDIEHESPTVLRIWMPNGFSDDLDYLVIGPAV